MTRQHPKVVTAQMAQAILAMHGVRLHIRTVQRWAHRDIAGGFMSRSGRCLYRSGALMRAMYA